MGVFSKNEAYVPGIKRNSYDLSYQNNLTLRSGFIYPFMVQPVLPGDSVRVKAALGIRMMPMKFPIQTKIRADVHFFYVRNRNIWKDWPNFIGGVETSSLSLPYLTPNQRNKHLVTKSLGDYLGLPTTVVGNSNRSVAYPSKTVMDVPSPSNGTVLLVNPATIGSDVLSTYPVFLHPTPTPSYVRPYDGISSLAWKDVLSELLDLYSPLRSVIPSGDVLSFRVETSTKLLESGGNYYFYLLGEKAYPGTSSSSDTYMQQVPVGVGTISDESSYGVNFYRINFNVTSDVPLTGYYNLRLAAITTDNSQQLPETLFSGGAFILHRIFSGISTVVDGSSIANSLPNDFKISALPFRAYESIYNAFYRDDRNNPYVLNGKTMINDYIPTHEGGADDNDYILRRRNWEQDFMTSAVPNPQMGIAPLVGITSSGRATFLGDDGKEYQVQLQTSEDGDTVVGGSYSENLPNSVARQLVNMATEGISINDFRNVNSFQRWLEANYRKGLKYKDQLLSHFGVETSYAELDMPEFLGGFSEFVQINQINQTSESTSDQPLGSFAGQGSLVGGSKHDVNRYFDEHGYLIGLVSVVPVPCYSQLLPKDFTKFSTLDYYFPEFGHIGFQPVPYREVCPLQANVLGTSLDSTFGYQRAWYDYLSRTDEVHGDFRLSLRDFILSRVFNQVPSLTPEFLTVDEDQMNDIFAVTDDSYDNMLGQIHIDMVMKRPIPRFGVPRLE